MSQDKLSEEERDHVSLLGLWDPIWGHRRVLVAATVVMTVLAMLVSGIHFWWQPLRWAAALEFRPTFQGAETGRYPNALPFAVSDITDPSIVDQVYDKNKVEEYCSRPAFDSAFSVEQRSPELLFIDADYQSRLTDVRLTTVDRQRLLDEYRAKRSGAPIQYALVFNRVASCRPPAAIVGKLLDEVLLTWANDSESKRGVLKQRVKTFGPDILGVVTIGSQPLFVRANLVWSNLDRVIRNIAEVEALPGVDLVRFGGQRVALVEVKARMEDLQHANLEALMVSIGAEHNRESIRWAEGALAIATSQQQVAQSRARANLDALREYSGVMPTATPPREPQRSPGAADVQSLTPTIDSTFIDRILAMSEPNTRFRQELTRSMLEATLDAIKYESSVSYYKQLIATLKAGGALLPERVLNAQLVEIVAVGKDLIRQFNGLYEEWSRSSFRPGPAMYHVEKPATIEVVRPFTLWTYVVAVALVAFITLVIAVLAAFVHTRLLAEIQESK